MISRSCLLLLAAGACRRAPEAEVGDYRVAWEDGQLTLEHAPTGRLVEALDLSTGTGSAQVEMSFGAFRFEGVKLDLRAAEAWEADRDQDDLTLVNRRGDRLTLTQTPAGSLRMKLQPEGPAGSEGRVAWSAPCPKDTAFLGFGSHAMDVDHRGQAFPLFVSEPGIGKSTEEAPPDDWPLRGSRHASSYPQPWMLLPGDEAQGWLFPVSGRVEADLCASDPDRWELVAWQGEAEALWMPVERPLQAVQQLTAEVGRAPLAPGWAFGPWNDAIRGIDEVRRVAEVLREAGAPSTVIWTEDWKGANETATGYRLSESWDLDAELYPDAAAFDAELEAAGFKWFAYFAPFVGVGERSGLEASAASALVQSPDGGDYVFSGVTFKPTAILDLSGPDGRGWAGEKIAAARAIGFDGWMVDYAEWLPLDGVLDDGRDGALAHNDYPLQWQQLHQEVLAGQDTAVFCRSGWWNTPSACPIVWTGDQRTSFDPDDGLPTVVPLSLGLAVGGVSVTTHDIAGYQSVGNDPSDKELFFRWTALGAFSPVMRTHHGSFDTANWRFDQDQETLDFWVKMAREHMRTWPYRYGLAARAAREGIPMVLPTVLRFPEDDPGRRDAWLLGDLLVVPVTERGATSWAVDLPSGRWFDWWTGAAASSGTVPTPLDTLPVYVADGSIVPVFPEPPDTLLPDAQVDLPFEVADAARDLLVYGTPSAFEEGDGTRYTPRGKADQTGEVSATFADGQLQLGGLTLDITGETTRTYTLRVLQAAG